MERPSFDTRAVRADRHPLAAERRYSASEGHRPRGDGRRGIHLSGPHGRTCRLYRRGVPERRVERHGGGGEHRRPHCRADRGAARRAGVRRPAERQPFPLRLDGERLVDARRSDSAGRAGGLCLLAGHPFDAHSDHRHRRLAGRHVRRHVAAGILDQPLDALRPRAGHRYGGR